MLVSGFRKKQPPRCKYLGQNASDAFARRICIALGILGEQLQRTNATVRTEGEHVGKGAAAVDGKEELIFHCCVLPAQIYTNIFR